METTSYLQSVIILLAASVVAAAFFRYLRLSPVLGYLIAGAAIGPYGFGIITNVHAASAIAEIGVVFLLFMIGLELTWERLQKLRAFVFGFGTLQVAITGLIIGFVVMALGGTQEVALIVGGGLALSSTAIVLQVNGETGERATQVGRLSLATLLLQDFAVVPLLVLVPLLAKGESVSLWAAVADASAKAAAALFLIIVGGRLLLRPLFKLIAGTRSSELFGAATLLLVLSAAWATEHAGLSLALGAFIAGLMVAETEFQHQVKADILPFKGLFLSLFFMTVGMSVNLELIAHKWEIILALTLALMLGKAALIMLLARLFRFARGAAVHAGLLLAQGGEFGFILFGLARDQGLLDAETTQMLLLLVSASMALTPLFAIVGKKIGDHLDRFPRSSPEQIAEDNSDLDRHVIVAGYGRMGRMVGSLLTLEKIDYVAVDLDPHKVTAGREMGHPVYYGDAARADVLKAVGIERAEVLVITFRGMKHRQKSQTVLSIRQSFPYICILARAEDETQAALLRAAGADLVVTETLEASLQLGGELLRVKGVADHE
ncbi:MAG: cation:proton antiporter, partial [Alphaproteobacteria bacterium]|nr:cation:proton antiporter [Alphaproteobacteria bacterium]